MARDVKIAIVGDSRDFQAAVDRADRGLRGLDDSVKKTGDSVDRTSSVFANFTGNAVQDLPGVSGSFGALNVAAGQFVEYATEGGISLKKMAASLGPIAAITTAIGLMSKHFAEIAEAKAFNADQAREWADAINDGASAVEAMRDSFVEAGKVEFQMAEGGGDLTGMLFDLGMKVEEFTALAQLSEDQIRAWGESQRDAGADVEAVTFVTLGAIQAHDNLAGAEERAAINAKILGTGQEELTDQTEDTGTAIDDTREALDSYTQAIKDWEEAVTEALPNELDLREAVRESTEALADYMTTMADVESTELEREAAADGVISAWLDQATAAGTSAEAQAIAAGRAETATDEGVAAQIWTLGQLAGTLGPNSPLRKDIEGHIAALQGIPRNLNTDITVSGNYAGQLTGARQHGGSVRRGGAYLVGEHGPEVVVPNSAGQVVPNDRLGGDVHLHVYGEPDEFTLTKLKRAAREAAGEARRNTNWSIG